MYNKVLKAKHSPENRCFAIDGEILTIIPKNKKVNSDEKYHFIGTVSKKESQYGWVAEVESFTLENFIEEHAFDLSNNIEKEYIKKMLDTIAKYKSNTPMGVAFVLRGMMQKSVELKVHKVFFYSS